jgi:phosphoglycolate phosphatase-like HAD superfamily hydrolase
LDIPYNISVKLLLFDVDQTLISTGGAGIRALNRAFKRHWNLDNALDGIHPGGKTDPYIVREVFKGRLGADDGSEAAVGLILDTYLLYLRDEVDKSETYRVLPGIIEILNDLNRREDVLIGLATGNIEAGARIKLERGRLNHYFSFGGFGSDSEDRAALVRRAVEMAAKSGTVIKPSDTFVIGDTPRDIAAGKENGFRTVGVATGRYSVEELRHAGATLAVSDFRQDRDHFLRSTFMA